MQVKTKVLHKVCTIFPNSLFGAAAPARNFSRLFRHPHLIKHFLTMHKRRSYRCLDKLA